MFDYYTHVTSLNEEKLLDEIKKLNKRLMITNQATPIYNQLLNMLDQAESAYQDIMYASRIKKESTVLDIGEIESTSYTPDYSEDTVLEALVNAYTTNFKRDTK